MTTMTRMRVRPCNHLSARSEDAMVNLRDVVLKAMRKIGRPCTPGEIGTVSGIPRTQGRTRDRVAAKAPVRMNDAIVTGVLLDMIDYGLVKRVETENGLAYAICDRRRDCC